MFKKSGGEVGKGQNAMHGRGVVSWQVVISLKKKDGKISMNLKLPNQNNIFKFLYAYSILCTIEEIYNLLK